MVGVPEPPVVGRNGRGPEILGSKGPLAGPFRVTAGGRWEETAWEKSSQELIWLLCWREGRKEKQAEPAGLGNEIMSAEGCVKVSYYQYYYLIVRFWGPVSSGTPPLTLN